MIRQRAWRWLSLMLVTGGSLAAAGEMTPLSLRDFAAVASWENGRETALAADAKWFIGTRESSPGYTGIAFGDSPRAGPRHLCVRFAREIEVGAVLVLGGGSVSVLKPDAPYPGDIADESQWLPATRWTSAGATRAEAGRNAYAVWTLPRVLKTRAVRFTHLAQVADAQYAGWLGGAHMLAESLVNRAPDATVIASANRRAAARLNNETPDETWHVWDNTPQGEWAQARPVAEQPATALLVWPRPVSLRGVAFLWAGFSAADIQVFADDSPRAPRDAEEADWKTVSRLSGLKNRYPSMTGCDWADFGATVVTRAIRVRMTAVTDESHPHMKDNTVGGKRVWLAELMALGGNDRGQPSEAGVRGADQGTIPIDFTTPDAGFVTLVIEDRSGRRVRNLLAETFFPAGRNRVYWDGADDRERDLDAAAHGLYSIPARMVEAGEYQVRGLWRKAVDLRYEFSVNSPGTPPWPTADGTGGWTTNHTPPSSALFVPGAQSPTGNPVVYLGSYISEGGAALAWVDLDGRKQGGRGWIGGLWTGAQFLARDVGARADPDVIAYVGSVWEVGDRKDHGEYRITALTKKADVAAWHEVFDFPEQPDRRPLAETMGGLAVHNGLIAYSQPALNRITLVRTGKIIGTVSLPDPQGVAFERDGHLLVLSGSVLKRYAVEEPGTLAAEEVVVTGLDHPTGLTLDAAGDIYVAERGVHHQVKRFSPRGALRATFGVAGAPKAGRYNPNHLNNPRGLAVDANGRLWVTEEDFTPKRVSVWNADGSLWRAFYGPPTYGGGGTIDRRDPTRFDYSGMEFRLDWRTGESRLERVLYRPDDSRMPLAVRSGAPDTPIYIQQARFLTNAFTQNPTNGHNTAFLFADRGDVAVPVAAFGRADEWDLLQQPQFASRWPASNVTPKGRWFAWSDLNRDGEVEPDEVTLSAGEVSGVSVQEEGAFVIARATSADDGAGHAERFLPRLRDGVPCYDVSAPERLVAGAQSPLSTGGGQALTGSDGWTVLTTAPRPFSAAGIAGAQNGVPRWSYPSLWPGLHASHSAPLPEFPGELIGTTRLLGEMVTPRNSDAGPLFFLNGNLGCMYVFTQDGLMVATLFRDRRLGQGWTAPIAVRGMALDEIAPGDEHFFPTVAQAPDGRIYLVAGSIFSAIVRVEGLDSIRRIASFPLRVTDENLREAAAAVRDREATRQAQLGSDVWRIPLVTDVAQLGADWSSVPWVDIDRRGVPAFFNASTTPYAITAAMVVTPTHLLVRWRTADPKLPSNSGAMETALFKTGGGLDLMLGTDADADPKRRQPAPGDLRLLMARVAGKCRALLYRPVAPGTPSERKTIFRSPVHTLAFDDVEDVSTQVELTDDGRGNFQASIPLAVLGWKPRAGATIRGDIGVLRGNGTETIQRAYWSDKAVALLSDVPSEAALSPDLWGLLRLESADTK